MEIIGHTKVYLGVEHRGYRLSALLCIPLHKMAEACKQPLFVRRV